MLENYSNFFENSNLEYEETWLHKLQNILQQYKKYDDDLYKDCNELLDLFCIQILREIISDISNDYEFDLDEKIFDFIEIIHDLEIDFNLFVLIAGEDYLLSEYYSYEVNYQNNQFNIIQYLIFLRYDSVVEVLDRHYSDKDTLLLALLDNIGFIESYLEATKNISNQEETLVSDAVMKLIEWKENGFPLADIDF